MASNPLADVFMELLGSLSAEQKQAIQDAVHKAAAFIHSLIEAERAKQPKALPARAPAQPADIPDMRGRGS